MGADYYRLIRDAVEGLDRLVQPTQISNRTLLEFTRAKELLICVEQLTIAGSALQYPAQWGATTNGPGGGNWQWDLAKWG